MGWWRSREILSAGSTAPEFALRGLDGSSHTLRDLAGSSPSVLAFFKISCPVCQLTFPFLQRIHQRAADGSFRVIGVSQDDSSATGHFNREFGITFPTLLDEESKGYAVSNAFGISHVPALFLIETDGRISLAVEGFSKKDVEAIGARAGVSPFLSGEPVPEWKSG